MVFTWLFVLISQNVSLLLLSTSRCSICLLSDTVTTAIMHLKLFLVTCVSGLFEGRRTFGHTLYTTNTKTYKPNTIHIFSPKRDEREGGACEDTGLGCTAHDQERERALLLTELLSTRRSRRVVFTRLVCFHRA